MFRIKNHIFAFAVAVLALICTPGAVKSQGLPEVLNEGTLEEQYDYLQQRTTIYNDFRAIRDDMFRKIRRNTMDTLNKAHNEINLLRQQMSFHQVEKDTLQNRLFREQTEKNAALQEKEKMYFMGIPVSKTVYNGIVWSVIGILALLFLIIMFLYRRANKIANIKSREMQVLQVEYDEYRKTSRERFEKQAIDHFNEIKRNRGI